MVLFTKMSQPTHLFLTPPSSSGLALLAIQMSTKNVQHTVKWSNDPTKHNVDGQKNIHNIFKQLPSVKPVLACVTFDHKLGNVVR